MHTRLFRDVATYHSRRLVLAKALGDICAMRLAAALHASIANIEAVMIAGQWRKRDHALVYTDLDNAKVALRASGERIVHALRKSDLIAGLRRGVVRQVVHHRLESQIRS